ncbi:hypothetical protein IP84_10370 [beta proteobacterium AAP99]|nr:hypothetical protein IP84_10370 [beta proteobacterium AAP99]
MNRTPLAALALVTALVTASAAAFGTQATAPQKNPQAFQFNVEVRVGSAQPQAVGLAVLPRQVVRVPMGSDLILEVNAPAQDNEPSLVRLLRGTDNLAQVLHESRTLAPASVARTLAYRVCGQSVTFISPAPPAVPSCG